MANEVVGIDIVARLDGFREELGKIPDIGAKEARQLASQLSREIKSAEKAATRATNAAKAQARAMSTLTKAVSLGPIIEGAKKLAQAFKAGVDRAVELDNAVGGDLSASLAELKTQTGGLADSFLIELTPALVSSVKVLADVANGAKIAAQELFGLEQSQARNRAATEAGNRAVEAQADRVIALKEELARFKDESDTSSEGVQRVIAGLEKNVAAQVKVLQRLKGELQFGQNLTPGAKSSPAAAKSSARKSSGPDPAKEAEAQAARVEAAFKRIRMASEDYTAALAGDEAVIRLEQARTVEDLRANLAIVIDSTVATEEQRLAALAEFKAAEVALEEETAARIAEIRDQALAHQIDNYDTGLDARTETAAAEHAVAGSLAGSLVQLTGIIADAVVDGTTEETEARKEAAMAAFVANKIAAVAQGALNTALAVSNAIGSAPNPIAGAILGIAAGIAGGIATAAIAAQPPPVFHDGGMVGDEVDIRARRGEVVLPNPAVRAMGGPDGVAEVAAGGGMRELVIVQKLDHKVVDMQTHRAVKRTGSPLDSALRSMNPRGTGRRNPYQPRT